jgi:hypothetical protein
MIPYEEKRKQFSPEARERVDERANQIRSELQLQKTLGKTPGIPLDQIGTLVTQVSELFFARYAGYY